MKKLALCIGACAGAVLSPSAAAGEAISTDRPDFVESSDVVGPGHVQIETGFSSERRDADGVRSRVRTTPTLLRLGTGRTMELRIETDGFAASDARDKATGATQRERGFADVSLGVKWRMQDGDEAGGTPGIAWLAHLDLDSGTRAFRGQGMRPSLRLVAEWDLPHELSLGVMPGLTFDKNATGGRFVAGILGATLGRSWTPAWRTFVEIAGQQLAADNNGGSTVTLDAGVTHLVSESLQLDFAVARGLTSSAPALRWSVGMSVRF